MSRGDSRTRDRIRLIGLGAMSLVLVLSPELMGGHPAPAAVGIVVMASIAALVVQAGYGGRAPGWREPAIVGIAATAVVVAVQCVPLPASWVAVMAPGSAAASGAVAALFDAPPPAWIPLSLDATSSRRALIEGLALAAMFSASWTAAAGGLRGALVHAAGLSTLAVAVVVVAHLVLAVEQPFGLVQAAWWHPPLVGPLQNQNHLSGFLGAGVPLLLASGLSHQKSRVQWPWIVAAVFVAIVALMARSRGGVLSLSAGVATLVALSLRQREFRGRRRVVVWVGAALLLIALAASLWVVGGAMVDETMRDGLPKLGVFRRALDLVPRSPWFGVGRGAFSQAFVGLMGTLERSEYPENLLVQWVTELGIPATLVLCLGLGASLVRALRTARSSSQLGALASVVSFAVHDQFDFALELVGIAMVAAGVLGCALAPAGESRRRSGDLPKGRRASPGYFAAPALAVASVVALPVVDLSVPELERTVVAQADAQRWGDLAATCRQAMELHPAEPVFPMMLGYSAVAQDRPDALRWLNRAMRLAPAWYEPHRLAAEWLAGRGAIEQAWLEVRQVRRIQRDRAPVTACVVARRHGAAEPALRVFIDDLDLLDAIVQCPAIEGSARATLDAALARRGVPASLVRRARAELEAGHPVEALATLDAIPASRVDEAALLVRSDVLLATGQGAAAVDLLAARAETSPTVALLEQLARVQARTEDGEGMRRSVQRVADHQELTPSGLARNRMLLAELEGVVGSPPRAVRALEEAYRLDPDCGALERLVPLAESLGETRRARLARLELCRRDGPESEWCTARTGERIGVLPQLPTVP